MGVGGCKGITRVGWGLCGGPECSRYRQCDRAGQGERRLKGIDLGCHLWEIPPPSRTLGWSAERTIAYLRSSCCFLKEDPCRVGEGTKHFLVVSKPGQGLCWDFLFPVLAPAIHLDPR